MNGEYTIKVPKAIFWGALLIACVAVGVILGLIIFESRKVIDITNEKYKVEQSYEKLQKAFDDLNLEKEELTEQVQVLSDTINKRVAEDEAAKALEEAARIPSGFPVTGSVTETEAPEEGNVLELAVYYEADSTSVVVATAVGQVLSVRKNAYDNYEIQIDHGNEYISVYTNGGQPLLEEGVEVLKGTPLFYVGEENTLVQYQITYQGELVNAYDVMNIDG